MNNTLFDIKVQAYNCIHVKHDDTKYRQVSQHSNADLVKQHNNDSNICTVILFNDLKCVKRSYVYIYIKYSIYTIYIKYKT